MNQNNFDVCANCSSPFSTLSDDDLSYFGNGQKIKNEEITINSLFENSHKISILTALSSIFKLQYLNTFNSHYTKETEQNVYLCETCSQVLTDLYQLYIQFTELRQMDSFLQQRIKKLDEIMLSRQVIDTSRDFKKEMVHQDSTVEESKTKTSLCKCRMIFRREPRIILTPLSVHLTEPKTPNMTWQDIGDSDHFEPTFIDNGDSDFEGELNSENPIYNAIQYNSVIEPHLKVELDNSDQNLIEINPSPLKIKPKSKTKCKNNKFTRRKATKIRSSSLKYTQAVEKSPKNIRDQEVRRYRTRRAKVPNPCWYCPLDCDTPEQLSQHTQTEHQTPGTFLCQRCSKIFLSEGSLAKHLKKCELIPIGQLLILPIACSECPRTFSTEKQLTRHMISHATQRPFSCDECPYTGKTLKALNEHKLGKHNNQETGKEVCDECGATLKNAQGLKLHKISMHTEEGHKKYRAAQQRALERDKEKRRRKLELKTTICDICNVDFFSHYGLYHHKKTHHVGQLESKFVCDICGKNFTRNHSLTFHVNTVHSEKRPFLCPKCGKNFKSADNLRSHDLHTHSEEGRLAYNAQTRERNRRKKLLQSQLALVKCSEK